jgi:hypothetical protein
MKRRFVWTAAIFLAGGAVAVASDPMLDFTAAQEGAEANPEVTVSPSDEPLPERATEGELSAPADVMAAPTGEPEWRLRAQMTPVSWSSGSGGCGCGAPLQCCERVPSHLDNVWDSYCQQKSNYHPVSEICGLLHIKRHCQCDCPQPVCHGCDCHLGLPTLPKLHVKKAPCGCEPCETYHRPRRSLLHHFRKPSCCEESCDAMPLEAPVVSPDFAPVEDPALSPPEPVAPPTLPLPEATSEAPSQGWLPLPWLKRLPL